MREHASACDSRLLTSEWIAVWSAEEESSPGDCECVTWDYYSSWKLVLVDSLRSI